jgi:hypothetical protein
MTEETFVRELERHADRVHGAPLSFEDVRGKAHAIRRRRRATAAGVVAAAVALMVVVPTVLAGGLVGEPDAPEPAPPVPGRTAVLHDGRLTLPDTSTVDLDVDNADVSELGVLTDGRIVLAMMQPYAVRVYEPDGSLQEQYRVAANTITVSPGDDAVAWVAKDLSVQVLESGVTEPATFPGIPMPGEAAGSVDAVTDSGHLLVGDFSTTTHELTTDSARELRTSQPFRVTDVSPDGTLWAVQYPDDSDPQYGCSGLYDPEGQRMTARSCETNGLRFSPDGEHVLSRFAENIGQSSEVTVLDLDLKPVTSFEPDGRVIKEAAWADATHMLVSVARLKDDRWSLVRVPIDGSDQETLQGPVPGRNPELASEFLLSE